MLAVPQSMAVVSPKSQGASLPTANSTFSHKRLYNGQEESSSLPSSAPSTSTASASPGVAYAIISAASPAAHGVSGVTEAIKVQPLIFSPDSKVRRSFITYLPNKHAAQHAELVFNLHDPVIVTLWQMIIRCTLSVDLRFLGPFLLNSANWRESAIPKPRRWAWKFLWVIY